MAELSNLLRKRSVFPETTEMPSGAVQDFRKRTAAMLRNQAVEKYPFIKQYDPTVTVGSGDGYAETWFPQDFGPTGTERPKNIPAESLGIEIRRPNEFRAEDLAGEVLHYDPRANQVRGMLDKTLSPQQWDVLKREALDYDESVRLGMPESRVRENTIDSAIRGFTVNQWPESINQAMQYTPEQLEQLNALKAYMTTGQ